MKLDRLRHTFTTYGTRAVLLDVTKRALSRAVPLRVLRGLRVTRATLDERYLALPPGFAARFLSRDELERYARDPSLDLGLAFLDDALAKGDRCYALFDGETLAAYGWYATVPTRITDTLVFHFDPSYAYMYKGLTRPAHRGKRLHAVGMARALNAYVRGGSEGILSYVDSSNFASLHSCYRMGYQGVGDLYVLGAPGHEWTWASPGCARYALRIEARCDAADRCSGGRCDAA